MLMVTCLSTCLIWSVLTCMSTTHNSGNKTFKLSHFFINFKDQGQFWNLLVMRILKLSLMLEIDEEMTKIFKVKGNGPFPKKQ